MEARAMSDSSHGTFFLSILNLKSLFNILEVDFNLQSLIT